MINATNNTVKATNFNSEVCMTPAPSTSRALFKKDMRLFSHIFYTTIAPVNGINIISYQPVL